MHADVPARGFRVYYDDRCITAATAGPSRRGLLGFLFGRHAVFTYRFQRVRGAVLAVWLMPEFTAPRRGASGWRSGSATASTAASLPTILPVHGTWPRRPVVPRPAQSPAVPQQLLYRAPVPGHTIGAFRSELHRRPGPRLPSAKWPSTDGRHPSARTYPFHADGDGSGTFRFQRCAFVGSWSRRLKVSRLSLKPF